MTLPIKKRKKMSNVIFGATILMEDAWFCVIVRHWCKSLDQHPWKRQCYFLGNTRHSPTTTSVYTRDLVIFFNSTNVWGCWDRCLLMNAKSNSKLKPSIEVEGAKNFLYLIVAFSQSLELTNFAMERKKTENQVKVWGFFMMDTLLTG